eukprot:SAG31_NODE_1944_length_6856_cov_3.850969_5_plen_64_part_00
MADVFVFIIEKPSTGMHSGNFHISWPVFDACRLSGGFLLSDLGAEQPHLLLRIRWEVSDSFQI